ncbi:hypothetical protein DXG03_000538 [Asterophora parasitica]|uniref:Uncharacterized protein n=1 Tax=Asterophora parasitica TaxID=117018 RepID=A0A9P7G500_9AGAR|nr:hypothetical protein DXG03_000538 [Asterophora parasitica]
MGWVRTLALLRYGKVFQRHRRMMQQYLNANKCLSYQPAQAREVRVLLQHLLKAPAERDAHLGRFSTAVIMELTYGHRVKSDDDPYLKYTKEVNKVMHNSGSPGSTPVDLVPFCTYYRTKLRR